MVNKKSFSDVFIQDPPSFVPSSHTIPFLDVVNILTSVVDCFSPPLDIFKMVGVVISFLVESLSLVTYNRTLFGHHVDTIYGVIYTSIFSLIFVTPITSSSIDIFVSIFTCSIMVRTSSLGYGVFSIRVSSLVEIYN